MINAETQCKNLALNEYFFNITITFTCLSSLMPTKNSTKSYYSFYRLITNGIKIYSPIEYMVIVVRDYRDLSINYLKKSLEIL